jgi:transposase-like protein
MPPKTFDVPGGQIVVVPDPKAERPTRRTYPARYKAAILAEYDQLDKRGKGELLRREGLYTSLISAWREQRDRYRAAFPSTSPERLRETALSDWLYRIPTLHLAEAAHAGGAQVWLYELCWGFGSAGASHGLDTLLCSEPPTSTPDLPKLVRKQWPNPDNSRS